jgi:RNA polymerase sigma-70 factor, ECF subfamily
MRAQSDNLSRPHSVTLLIRWKRKGHGRPVPVLRAFLKNVMPIEQSEPVTHLLLGWAAGDRDCLDGLILLLDAELRHIAHRYMRLERDGHMLQTTALINEAYLRLVNETEVKSQHRTQFLALAAHVMRHILVDHARGVSREKRGNGIRDVPLDEAFLFSPQKSSDLVALDEALSRLADSSARKAKVVELRYFGGMSVEEVAEALEVHPNTVVRDWKLAKAWLKREVGFGKMDEAPPDA